MSTRQVQIKISLFLLIVFSLILSLSIPAVADDNEIFGVVEQDVEPNILIIIDNSGSMGTEVPPQTSSACENAGGSWDCVDQECVETECNEYKCVERNYDNCIDPGLIWCNEYECVERNYDNCIDPVCVDTECQEWECNYYDSSQVPTRMEVTKDTVKDLIYDYAIENRLGIMTFNSYEGGWIVKPLSTKNDYLSEDGTFDSDTSKQNYKDELKQAVDDLTADGMTPLAETMFEAGKYFAEESSAFNSGTDYANYDPIEYHCRENHIILLSDGQPTYDNHVGNKEINGNEVSASSDYTNYYNSGDPELQDVSDFLHDNEINDDFVDEYNQPITTHTIGFSEGVDEEARQILQDTSDTGSGLENTPYENDGGLFFYATSQYELSDAFDTIMANIDDKNTSFTSPTVPVHDVNNAYSGEYGYMSMFQPQNATVQNSSQSRWKGNLKKYRINDDQEFTSCCSDPPCDPILNNDGKINGTAQSCWTTGQFDGGDVGSGGAGQVLSERSLDRNIYSNLNADKALSNNDNAFSQDNSNLSPGDFGVSTENEKDEIIKEIRMEGKDWRLGDLNHSKPALAKYENGKYIFAGSNDGMLHCFDDDDGTEEWAFVPEEQFSRLQEAYTGSHSYFMDGSPTVADTSGGKVVICGERRGGNNYYAIDITNIGSPEYLYKKSVSGQSWKQPQFITFPTGGDSSQEAFLLSGGYDVGYDTSPLPSDPKGNDLTVIDATSGNQIKRFDDSTISTMNDSIVSAFAVEMIDDGEKLVSQMYAGDMGGNVFAFRNADFNADWQSMRLFEAESSGKKIFHELDVVLEYIEYYDDENETWNEVVGQHVFFGTGDRANPLDDSTTNYFYCVKNDWRTGNLTTSSQVGDFDTLNNEDGTKKVMLDVTDNLIQEGNATEQELVEEELNARYNRGWYIELEHEGEKCLSTPMVYNGVVYFTTFAPTKAAKSSDPCDTYSDMGVSRLYALDYKTGGAVYDDYDGDPDDELGKDDRSTKLQQENITIAPDPTTIISDEGDALSIGPVTKDIKSGPQIFYWKQK